MNGRTERWVPPTSGLDRLSDRWEIGRFWMCVCRLPLRRARVPALALVVAWIVAMEGAGCGSHQDRSVPSFGRPTIVGVQAGGNSEPGLAIDTQGRLYVTSPVWPFSALWRSLDGGASFKWVPAADAKTGRLATCRLLSGGDSEVATDLADRVYFSDRFAALASPYNTSARSDDHGVTFRSSCNAVSSDSTDRPWYAVDGDPLVGGSIYLAVAIIGGDRACNAAGPADELAFARSPMPGRRAEAGISFGPLTVATGSCAMGSLGEPEVSPATHHVFVPHSAAAAKRRGADEVRVARCERTRFGPAAPGGLRCVDRIVTATPGAYVGAVTLAIDRAGNLYVVWDQLPFGGGDFRLFLSTSRDDGSTWTAPVTISTAGLHTNIFPWVAAGDPGRVDLAWYGTSTVDPKPNDGCDGPADADGDWSVYFAQTLDGLARKPTFTSQILASETFIHRGGIASVPGGKFCGNGVLGDFLQLRIGLQGEANIVYADSNNANGVYPGVNDPNSGQLAHPMFVRQNGGPGVYRAHALVHGRPPATNHVRDPAGDATFDAGGRVSHSMPNLDLRGSSIASDGEGKLRITLEIGDLTSLAPDTSSGDDDTYLVWLVQWFSPSKTDPHGGKNHFAYMESAGGRAPSFWVGESARAELPTTWPGFTYPGAKRVNGSYTRTVPGRIRIEVPMSDAYARNPLSRTLYSVTASTMTLAESLGEPPPQQTGSAYVGGSFFNLIDSAPSYDFIPS